MAKCSHVRNLNLSCNQMLTDKLFDFSEKGRGKLNLCRLSRVDLSGCQGISSTAVRYMLSLFGSFLQSINISWTKIDCTALVYLSGYSLSSAVYLATNSSAEMPFSVAELEASQEFELQITKNQVSTQIHDILGASCAVGSRDGALRKCPPTPQQSVSTEDMNDEMLGSIHTGVNGAHQMDVTINQRPSVDENVAVWKMQTKVVGKPQPESEKVLNVVHKHRHNISGKRYCSMCNRSESLGLRRAHSYTCIDEDDLPVSHSDTRNILFHNYDSRLSKSSSNLESLLLFSRTELSSALPFVKTKHTFVAQDSCHLQDVSTKSSYLGMCSESCNINRYTDSIALRECALERDFDADSDSSEQNEGRAEELQFFSLKDEETSRKLFKSVQTQYRDASKASELALDSVPVKDSKTICNGSNGSEDRQQLCKTFSEEAEASVTHIDMQNCIERNSNSDKEKSTGVSDCELKRVDLSNMESLLSSQAEFYKPRQMFASQITDLDISQIKFYDFSVGVQCIKMFVTSNHQLQSLSISWQSLTDSILEIIVTNEPNLMKISLVS